MSTNPVSTGATKKSSTRTSGTSAGVIEERTPLAELIASGVDQKYITTLELQTAARDYACGDFGAISEGHYTEF